MDSALLHDETLLMDSDGAMINTACDLRDEETPSRPTPYPESYQPPETFTQTEPDGSHGDTRLSRSGSEGNLLARSPETPPGHVPGRRPSLPQSGSLPHGDNNRLDSVIQPDTQGGRGQSLGRGVTQPTAMTPADLNITAIHINSRLPRHTNTTLSKANVKQSTQEQLSIGNLLEVYKMGAGDGVSRPQGSRGPGEKERAQCDTEITEGDPTTVTVHSHRAKADDNVVKKPTKSILDGCGKCGKVKTSQGTSVPGNDARDAVCTCTHEDIELSMENDAPKMKSGENSLADKAQKVLERMHSAFSTTSSTVSGVSSMDDKACRICWVGEEREKLVMPCDCSGSSAHIHPSCLRKWLQVTSEFHCEICRHEYVTKRKMKQFSEWKWRSQKTAYMSQVEATLILLGIVTPPLVCGIILCSQKIMEYINSPEDAWKTAALMTLVLASSCTYIAAIVYLCRKFSTICRVWIKRNQTMIVQIGDIETVIIPEEEGEATTNDTDSLRERAPSVSRSEQGESAAQAQGQGQGQSQGQGRGQRQGLGEVQVVGHVGGLPPEAVIVWSMT